MRIEASYKATKDDVPVVDISVFCHLAVTDSLSPSLAVL